MNCTLFVVPWDSAMRAKRMGAGPGHLIEAGIAERLRARGHEVEIETIEPRTDPPAEIATAFDLMRSVSEGVSRGRRFPILLSGNCNTTAGLLAGLSGDLSLVWFDAHGDFNTPEITRSGYLDGMALAIATGRCFRALASSVPGFSPVPESRVLLVGARDIDDEERAALRASGIRELPPERARDRDAVTAALDGLEGGVHLHVDLDVLDVSHGSANHFAVAGGLDPADLHRLVDEAASRLPIRGLTLASFDPASDPPGGIARIALEIAERVVDAAAGSVTG